ncbi:AP2/ERF family transcription factor [Agrobacterium sp. lyk4-40-TYG-31]|uniref:AP2/ERF family transcription factor n=1 Tax=Agrobacterium sp. lyk4-40-TYG-31 TaxID=3040276 RepID=UPI00254B08B4|nr:AP2/ERF family transcription factor [Agrobacterium sp. lyk4-40-TYG-31]
MALVDMHSTLPKKRTKAHSPTTKHDAEGYGLHREEANERRGASWWVSLRRRGHKIVRLFKDSIYGSNEAAYRAARYYRDAIIAAIPPATNHEQAVLLRKTNQSGISGVRRIKSREGDAWQATLMTNCGQKRENFSVSKFGEPAAKSMAIAQRRKWLADLPVTHLAYAHHAAEVAQEHFAADLIPVKDVMPETHLTHDEIETRIKSINDDFDNARPKRLRVRVKCYHGNTLSVFVSDAGKPAKRKLVQINTRKLDKAEMLAAARSVVEATITEFYDSDVARWFMDAHGDNLLTDKQFHVRQGFNVLVFLPTEFCPH